MSISAFEVIPSAKRLVKSLRDMGYEFAAAVADIVDNSIEAKASVVRIDVGWQDEAAFVAIADNGNGMSATELREAMRFGSEREYDSDDLGKFGLGLKTASMSQCAKLTVASRQNNNRADISAYCWDLDHVEATNRWEILQVPTAELISSVRQPLKEATGTVVLWERLDRILGYKKPTGEFARKHLATMCREMEEHLAMVFHRFLAGEVRGKKLTIYLNNNKISPWDPFARDEAATAKLDAVSIRVEGESARADVVLEPYVLPTQSQFSSSAAHGRASGPAKWNRQQGFYIYRADRMVQSGGWSGLRTLDEHSKLARVALSFSPRLDEIFKINVPKMRVVLPVSIRAEIDKAIIPALRIANAAYRQGERKTTTVVHAPAPQIPVPRPIPKGAKVVDADITDDDHRDAEANLASGGQSLLPTTTGSHNAELEKVGKLLARVSRPDELPVVQRVLARARQTLGN